MPRISTRLFDLHRGGRGLRRLVDALQHGAEEALGAPDQARGRADVVGEHAAMDRRRVGRPLRHRGAQLRSEEHTSELQSHSDLVCRLLLEKKKKNIISTTKESKLDNQNVIST